MILGEKMGKNSFFRLHSLDTFNILRLYFIHLRKNVRREKVKKQKRTTRFWQPQVGKQIRPKG